MTKLTSLPLFEPVDKAQVSALSGHPCDNTDDNWDVARHNPPTTPADHIEQIVTKVFKHPGFVAERQTDYIDGELVYLSFGERVLWKRERHFFFSSANLKGFSYE